MHTFWKSERKQDSRIDRTHVMKYLQLSPALQFIYFTLSNNLQATCFIQTSQSEEMSIDKEPAGNDDALQTWPPRPAADVDSGLAKPHGTSMDHTRLCLLEGLKPPAIPDTGLTWCPQAH